MILQDINQYLIHCPNCKKQTPHYINKVSLKRGVLLMCSKCGSKKSRYYKLNLLHEYSFNEKEVKPDGK